MNLYHERIEADFNIPAKIHINKGPQKKHYFPLHWHSYLEFDLVLDGRITGRINGKYTEVCPGEFFFVNSNVLHETDSDPGSEHHAITLLLSYDLLKNYYPDIDSCYFDFTGKETEQNQIKDLIIQCAELYQEKNEFYELELSILLRNICRILLKDCRMEKQEDTYTIYNQKRMNRIKEAIAYLEENYRQEISLKNIAAELGMSPNYFSRFFKNAAGKTFYNYLTMIRLHNAQRELLNSDATITEIALNNGFSNVKSFIEAFKKTYKVPPAKYRRLAVDNAYCSLRDQ